jgi:hypothetical protein
LSLFFRKLDQCDEFHVINYNIASGKQIALDARIARRRANQIEPLDVIMYYECRDNKSWFRDTPHYWAEASLPLAYAMACVEVVCRSSEKARILTI